MATKTHLTHEQLNSRLGAAIKNRRVILGKSQNTLAKTVGITFQQVQKYEKGTNQLSFARLYDIARALEMSMGGLVAVALREPAERTGDVSDRAMMEMVKRLSLLKPNQRKGVALLVNNLVEDVA